MEGNCIAYYVESKVLAALCAATLFLMPFKEFSFHLTSNEEISVEFACDTAANVICVFLVGVELGGIWDVPKSTGVVV